MIGDNKMKKISYLILSILVMCSTIGLCGCGGNGGEDSTTESTSSKEVESTSDKETESSEEDNGKVKYTVTVVDEEGNPVVGAMVQLCKDSCVPAMTKDNGVAEFNLKEDDYDVKFAIQPEGFEAPAEKYNFEEGKTDLTITLKKIS